MSKKLAICLLALVLLPLALLAWMGVRASADDEMRVRQQLRNVLLGRLRDTHSHVAQAIGQIELTLLQQLDQWVQQPEQQKQLSARNARSPRLRSLRVTPQRLAALYRLKRKQPLVRQAFWLNQQGTMLYPNPTLPKSSLRDDEWAFLQRTRAIWERKAILSQPRQVDNLLESANPNTYLPSSARPGPRALQPTQRRSTANPPQPQGSTANLDNQGRSPSRANRANRANQANPTTQPNLGNRGNRGNSGKLPNRGSQPNAVNPTNAGLSNLPLPRQRPQVGNDLVQQLQHSLGSYQAPNVKQQKLSLRRRLPSAARRPGQGDSIVNLASGRGHGWIVWYWAEGLHLLFWKRLASGGIVGVEVDRIVLMAQLIGILPGTSSDSKQQRGRVLLIDDKSAPIYQWGTYDAPAKEAPLARLSLGYPLHVWQLAYYGPERLQFSSLARRIQRQMLGLFALVGCLLSLLAFYLYREYSRDMRDAAQRMSFVTQVSHELKTPLTNIRLYAELLEAKLPEEQPRSRRHVKVIVSESERLSRLINNILTFARQRRGSLKLRPVATPLDPLIERIVEQFRPGLESQGFVVTLDCQAPKPALADPDAVEQILGNLFSNVTKYAAAGQWLGIRSHQEEDGTTHIEVEDRGPGVARGMRQQIFQPFVRCSDKLSDGVAGTGIGLTIARELAWVQSGELSLLDSDVGARFRLTLPAFSS